ncbi:MAG: hypothetical protein ND895_06400 [Pyrinomonadaceae bacterium]|nr:hypothetical protein [Pyrinomonadaceae bacterium]
MLTESFQSIARATGQLLKNWSAMIVLAGLYASLIAVLYLFATIREASAGQVILSLLLAIVAPLLFFVLQTAGASQIRNLGAGRLLRDTLKNSWKVVLIGVPLIGLAVLMTYLLGKIQSYIGSNGQEVSDVAAQYQLTASRDGAPALRWSQVTLNALRYLSLGFVLPLIAMHLWVASVGNNFLVTIRATKDLIVAAFAPNSVLIYTAGFVVFGLIPYLLLFRTTPASKAWMEITLLVTRLLLVFLLTLFGWVVTMSALATSASNRLSHLRES